MSNSYCFSPHVFDTMSILAAVLPKFLRKWLNQAVCTLGRNDLFWSYHSIQCGIYKRICTVFAQAPGIDKSDNGHNDMCTFLLLWLSMEVEIFTKNSSMAPAGADHVICTRAFRATVFVAVDDGLG